MEAPIEKHLPGSHFGFQGTHTHTHTPNFPPPVNGLEYSDYSLTSTVPQSGQPICMQGLFSVPESISHQCSDLGCPASAWEPGSLPSVLCPSTRHAHSLAVSTSAHLNTPLWMGNMEDSVTLGPRSVWPAAKTVCPASKLHSFQSADFFSPI